MTDSGGKKVVFRIADIGFSLDVDSLMEIRETSDVVIDTPLVDSESGILGLISFRDDAIRILDIRKLFGLPPADDDPVLVIVVGTDGAWVFPVETIIGIALADELRSCDVPPLLKVSERLPFTLIDIWRNEPLVCFDPVLIEQLRVPS